MTLVAPRTQVDTTVDVVEPGRRLEISGRLDVASVHEIRQAIDIAIAAGRGDLVVDIRTAEVHDSAGLGVFVGAHRRAVLAGRRLVLVHPSERFDRLARAARLNRILHLEH